MRNRVVLSLILLLLIAAALPSCKSPISPTPAGPTLTLILPDSAHAFDTVTFRAHYSDSLKPTWNYVWQFGDSTKASTRDTAILHSYDSAGTYTVQLALTDTVLHQTIAKQTGQMKIMPLNGPTLTLTVPDTNYWGDSCVMSASSSQPLKPGWKFSWSLGDSTTVTGADSVLHYYLTPGNYKVTVSLNDTVRHIPLASKSVTIPVVARHFNLALLQSMPYVDYFDNGKSIPGAGSGGSWVSYTGQQLIWKVLNFTYDTSYSYNYTYGSGNYGYVNSGNGGSSITGSVDSFATRIILFETGYSKSSSSVRNDGGDWSKSTGEGNFNVTDIPFIEETDSDVVFQSTWSLITASGGVSSSSQMRGQGTPDLFSAYEIWPDSNSRIIIRFHK
jgi:hypothetical protein